MTGAPVPPAPTRWCPTSGPTAAPTSCGSPRRPSCGQHIRHRRRRRRRRATCSSSDGDRPRPAPARPARVGRPGDRCVARPRPRVVILSTGSELREPGTALGHDSIYDGNSFLLAAAVRRAGAIAYRVGIVPDEPAAFLEALDDQLVRADVVITTGGVSPGRLRRRQGGAGARWAVWFGPVAMQPGKPQGFGRVGEDRVADLHAARQPGVGVRLLRGLRAAGAAQADGPDAVRRPTVTARLTTALSSPAGPSAVPSRRVRVDDQGAYVDAGRRCTARTWSGTSPRPTPDRGAGGRHVCRGRRAGRGADAGPESCMIEPEPAERLTHVDEAGAARMVDVSAKDVTTREADRVRPGARLARGRRAAARRGRAQGRRARRRAARRDHGRQAHPRPGAAVPPARDLAASPST